VPAGGLNRYLDEMQGIGTSVAPAPLGTARLCLILFIFGYLSSSILVYAFGAPDGRLLALRAVGGRLVSAGFENAAPLAWGAVGATMLIFIALAAYVALRDVQRLPMAEIYAVGYGAVVIATAFVMSTDTPVWGVILGAILAGVAVTGLLASLNDAISEDNDGYASAVADTWSSLLSLFSRLLSLGLFVLGRRSRHDRTKDAQPPG
jgi:hypothetical protein